MQAANVILNFPEVIITKVKENGGGVYILIYWLNNLNDISN